jgi:hypothetical protein
MKTLTILALAGTLSLPLLAQPTINDDRGDSVRITIDHLEFAGASSDHVSFKLFTHVTAFRNAKVKQVRFSGMRLANIPFFIEPMEEGLQLRAGVETAAPAVPVTIYFRDLDGLQSIEEAVMAGEIDVTGHARAELDLGLIERIAVGQWNGLADISLAGQLPVVVPGGHVGRSAAILALRGVEKALPTATSALGKLRGYASDPVRESADIYHSSLVTVETHYALILNNGKRIDSDDFWLGFRMSDDLVMLPNEAVEPWRYNPDVMLALQSKTARLDPEARELTIQYFGMTGDAPSLANGGLRIEVSPRIEKESLLVQDGEKRVRVEVAKRDSNSNYDVLRIVPAYLAGSESPVYGQRPTFNGQRPIVNEPAQQSYDHVAVFHLTPGGKFNVVTTPAHVRGGRIVLDSPVDASAIGSIVVGPEGIVGMVQDERSAMLVTMDRTESDNTNTSRLERHARR